MSLAGLVIGKSGATIRELQESTGAKLDIPKDQATAVVNISGSKEAVAKATAQIKKLLESQTNPAAAFEGGTPVSIGPHASRIIGKGGATIKRIRAETGAELMIPRDGDPNDGTVLLKGTDEAVAAAKAMVEKIIADAADSDARYGGGGALPEGSIMIEVDCPDYAVGSIIGKAGANVKALQADTGAKVDIKRGSGKVQISGSEEAVAKAKEAVEATIQSQAERFEEREERNGGEAEANGDAQPAKTEGDDTPDWDAAAVGEW